MATARKTSDTVDAKETELSAKSAKRQKVVILASAYLCNGKIVSIHGIPADDYVLSHYFEKSKFPSGELFEILQTVQTGVYFNRTTTNRLVSEIIGNEHPGFKISGQVKELPNIGKLEHQIVEVKAEIF